jgi:hypothetical protein
MFPDYNFTSELGGTKHKEFVKILCQEPHEMTDLKVRKWDSPDIRVR